MHRTVLLQRTALANTILSPVGAGPASDHRFELGIEINGATYA